MSCEFESRLLLYVALYGFKEKVSRAPNIRVKIPPRTSSYRIKALISACHAEDASSILASCSNLVRLIFTVNPVKGHFGTEKYGYEIPYQIFDIALWCNW